MARPDAAVSGPPIALSRGADGLTVALSRQPGHYALKSANGAMRMIVSPAPPVPIGIAGPWNVSFDPSFGSIGTVPFTELVDWSTHPDAAVRHYSGKATYSCLFEFPAGWAGLRWYLDLGELHDLAAVRLNGRDLGVVWLPPWRVEVTDALRSGRNRLEIDIVNVWNNRLVGDLELPPEKRRSFILAPTVKKNAPLQPAGLLGPVTLRAAVDLRVAGK